MKRQFVILSAALICLLVLDGCAPVFSEVQSARMCGEGRSELTPYYSTVSIHGDGESDGLQNHLGIQFAHGFSRNMDLRFRFENVWFKEGEFGDGYAILGFGPKFSLVRDNIAFYLPVGRALGEETTDSWQLQPSLLITAPLIRNKLDFTLAPKYLVVFCDECEDFVAFNFGLDISDNISRWSIHPEFGLLYNPGEEGHVSQFSIGLRGNFGR
jgi:hypothetical protein